MGMLPCIELQYSQSHVPFLIQEELESQSIDRIPTDRVFIPGFPEALDGCLDFLRSFAFGQDQGYRSFHLCLSVIQDVDKSSAYQPEVDIAQHNYAVVVIRDAKEETAESRLIPRVLGKPDGFSKAVL